MQRDRVNNELQSLERKIRLLLSEYQTLKREYELVKEENAQLKGVLSSKDNQLVDFQKKVHINAIVDSISTGSSVEVEEVKEKLDNYISEIDKAIKQLSH